MPDWVYAVIATVVFVLIILNVIVSLSTSQQTSRNAEALASLQREVLNYFGVMKSHDIRTPLTVIQGCLDTLADARMADLLPPEKRSEIAQVGSEAARNLVKQLEKYRSEGTAS